MIHLHYKLTEKEFLDCNFYIGWQTPERKKTRIAYYIVSPIAYLILVGFLLYDRSIGGFDMVAITFIWIGLAVLILFTRFRIRARFDKQVLEMIRQSSPDSVLSETELIISETGISGKTKVAVVKYSWDAFQKKIIANDCYYLFVNARQALIIPSRLFNKSSEKDSFEKMLAQYLPLQADLPIPEK